MGDGSPVTSPGSSSLARSRCTTVESTSSIAGAETSASTWRQGAHGVSVDCRMCSITGASSSYCRWKSQSFCVIIHAVSGSRSRASSRRRCSSLLICRKNFRIRVPSSASCRSKVVMEVSALSRRVSQSMPVSISAIAREYHDRAKTAILPRAGVLTQNLLRKLWASSSSPGRPKAWKSTPRGSSPKRSSAIVSEIPEAFQPSTTTITGTPRARSARCRTPSSSPSVFRRPSGSPAAFVDMVRPLRYLDSARS